MMSQIHEIWQRVIQWVCKIQVSLVKSMALPYLIENTNKCGMVTYGIHTGYRSCRQYIHTQTGGHRPPSPHTFLNSHMDHSDTQYLETREINYFSDEDIYNRSNYNTVYVKSFLSLLGFTSCWNKMLAKPRLRR